jgi:tetratricopeptide (TPR) repeat protein
MKKWLIFMVVVGLSYGQRFDSKVREDFFAGFAGDNARLERGMKTCEQALAKDPKDPSALVWHGSGLYFQAGVAYRKGDIDAGKKLRLQGMQEMNDAVTLAPDSLQTRIPRGAILIASARFMDDALAKPLLETGVADYEKAMDLEKDYLPTASVHSRGELIGGLADGYRRLGNTEKSRELLQRLVRELPGSPYEKQAKRWLTDLATVGKQERFCLGCHVATASR